MLTIFTVPKAFAGHIGLIQCNAIRSWTRLLPRPEILICGDEPGVAETASDLGLRHVAGIARNSYGTPLLSDTFQRAQEQARYDMVCYVSCDIILLGDFMTAVARVAAWGRPFLLCGERRDLDVSEPLVFHPAWESELRQRIDRTGRRPGPWWVDYFVFPRGLCDRMPPFAVGRPASDNWLIRHTRMQRVAVVDGTDAITAIHQAHDYGHIPNGTGHLWDGPEAQANLSLAGGREHLYSLRDASHRLTATGVRSVVSLQRARRVLTSFAAKRAWGAGLVRPLRVLDHWGRALPAALRRASSTTADRDRLAEQSR
jgi:hypothetical protein